MNKKEIEFYLKFHKGFRKRHTLNSALKMNSSRWNRSAGGVNNPLTRLIRFVD